ncbi:MAG: 2-amino-4-hydroxy-6-hydroxymethyldihydropteridine diphosphokinase [Bacteroidetes bacterium]|nr:2-amino-4-hydroxy-6-hydroxymethyldihydropteridine diphosphokinase [Bacteroidota bacterium]
MNLLYLITGSNIGERRKNLTNARAYIEKKIGHIERSSIIYETEPWGNSDQPAFYNQVHIVSTLLSPQLIMDKLLAIEKQMGRVRTIKNAARIIDIDILFFNDEIINLPGLVIPHIEISNRRFVLLPMAELSPDMMHPVLKTTIQDLLAKCNDPLRVIPLKK